MQPLNTVLHTNWQNVQRRLQELLNWTPTQNKCIIVCACKALSITNSYMLDIWSDKKQAVPEERQEAIWNCQANSVAHGQTAASHVLFLYGSIT